MNAQPAEVSPIPRQATRSRSPVQAGVTASDLPMTTPAADQGKTLGAGDTPAPGCFTALASYANAGFYFVNIPCVNGKPTKGPRNKGWNLPQSADNPNGYTGDIEQAAAWIQDGHNVGLALEPSGVVSLDIDNLDETRRVFAGMAIDLDALLADPSRVEIQSGKAGKAKLLFRVPAGTMPPSKKLNFGKGKAGRSVFEIRHGSTDGKTLQDVLPPSIHPDTGQPYRLLGDVCNLPPFPPELLALWQDWPDTLKTFDPAFEPPKETAKPPKSAPPIKGERDAIAGFNAAYGAHDVLERNGYRRKGERWLRPGSESGIPGVTVLDRDGRTVCFSHGGDGLNDGRVHDAFDTYRILECGGDWKTALDWNPEITAHNRALWAEKQKAERQAKRKQTLELGAFYTIDAGRICKSGDIAEPLCNFTAKIVEETLIDDGENATIVFAIEGKPATGPAFPQPRIDVPAAQFAGMGWVTSQWGIRASINAGNSNKDHLRAALQELSGDVPRRTVYAHTGWRKIGEKWVYLHGGGALGADGNREDVEVNPGAGNMKHYRLTDPADGEALATALRASLDLRDLAPHKPEVGALLLAVVYRAALAECAPIDHAAWMVGYTGARKSEWAAMGLAHFGQSFNSRNFPANWTDTVSVLEVKAHAAKDALFIVDDFKPHGSKGEIDGFHAKADKLIRGVGNQAGRGRLFADLKQRTSYHPRGFVLATGEDTPRGQSLRGRMTIANLSRNPHDPRRGDIDLDRLTLLQGHARNGTLAGAMAGYIRWLAPQIDTLKKTLPDLIRQRRDEAAAKGLKGHSRTPDIYASLTAGITLLCQFAAECGAMTSNEADAFFDRCCAALWSLSEDQGDHQASQDDVTRFLALLASALASGRCHLFDLAGNDKGCPTDQSGHSAAFCGWFLDAHGVFQPKGARIGWIEGDVIYLDGDAVYSTVTEYAREQGGNIEVTQTTLFQRIFDRGFLARVETEGGKTRYKIRKRILGANPRVYALRMAALLDESPN